MASDKEQMLSNANYYAGLVTSAKNDCADAFVQLTTPISEIERYWKGQSGEQMAQSVEEARQKIKRIYDRLVSIESRMKTQATTIYNTWPESKEET